MNTHALTLTPFEIKSDAIQSSSKTKKIEGAEAPSIPQARIGA